MTVVGTSCPSAAAQQRVGSRVVSGQVIDIARFEAIDPVALPEKNEEGLGDATRRALLKGKLVMRFVIRLGAVALAISALLLAAFPLVRPFGDRTPNATLVVETYASASWVISHMLGALGFVLLPVGLFGLYTSLRGGPVENRALQGLVLSWLGVGLFLPIFGSEAFALRAIGKAALDQNNVDLLMLAHSTRMGPQFGFLVSGLSLLAIGAILTGVAVWKSATLPRWSGVLLAVGLALFLPLLPQLVRVVDGLLIGVGGVWIALSMLRQTGAKD